MMLPKINIFEEGYVDNLVDELSKNISNDHARRGYKAGYCLGVNDAKDAKISNPDDIKILKEDVNLYDSFWAQLFPASSGLIYYKYGYKDGYTSGYTFYLEYVKGFFEGYLGGTDDELAQK